MKITPEYLLEDCDDKTKKLVQRLRKLILETIPSATEKAYPVWNGIGYRHPEAGTFCGIFLTKNGVKIYFMHGKLLKDQYKILQGDHLKMTRFIPFRNEKDIKVKPLKSILKESVKL